jgi:FixJ family two-component response regulator
MAVDVQSWVHVSNLPDFREYDPPSGSQAMSTTESLVYVVDDDPRVREAVQDLLFSCGLEVVGFGSAADYMQHEKPDRPACLILDIELPGINGLDLQRRLAGTRHPPIVFITGYGDVPSSVRAMKAGAVDFLPKPFSPQQLLAAVDAAVGLDRQRRAAESELKAVRSRYDLLTPRERDVLPLIVAGFLNKQAAAELGISEVTLQIHRRNIMRKMAARSVSNLVRLSLKLGIPVGEDSSIPKRRPESPPKAHGKNQGAGT